jgi:antitoxin component of MazEF toxin-antitoxin module
MKRLLTLIISVTLALINIDSQNAPIGINYQAVARDNSGTELANQSLDVKFSIFLNSPTGTLEWEETENTQTNQFGLFTLTIGLSNNRTGGTAMVFDSIRWGAGPHYLMVEVNFGGSTYVNMGTTQMLAVPYALYAKTAGNGGGSTPQITYDPNTQKLYVNSKEVADFSGVGANAVQNINLNGNLLTYSQNGQDHTIDFSKYLDNTDAQTLSLKGRELSISNGNSVMLPDTVVQSLSLNNQVLSISNGNSVTLPNQIQDLTWANDTVLQITNNPSASRIDLKKFLNNQLTTGKNKLSISNGNTVIVNTDTTKQDLAISNDTLYITKNQAPTKISLKKYLDNTDNQILALSGNNMSISGGNTIDVTKLVNVPWEGFSYNNNSGVAIPGLTESQIAWNKEFDDGNLIQSNALVSTSNSAVYSISLSLILSSSNNVKIKFYVGTNEYKSFDSFSNSLSTSFLIKLNQGDSVSIKIQNNSSFAVNLVYAVFSGYRVH